MARASRLTEVGDLRLIYFVKHQILLCCDTRQNAEMCKTTPILYRRTVLTCSYSLLLGLKAQIHVNFDKEREYREYRAMCTLTSVVRSNSWSYPQQRVNADLRKVGIGWTSHVKIILRKLEQPYRTKQHQPFQIVVEDRQIRHRRHN